MPCLVSSRAKLRKTLLFAAVLQLVSAAAQAGDIHWQAVQLPDLPGLGARQSLEITAMNNAGMVAGFASDRDTGLSRAFLYAGGQMVALGEVSTANAVWRPTAISDPQGLQGGIYIVGNIVDLRGQSRSAFVQQASTFGYPRLSTAKTIAFAGVETLSISGVNQSGQVVGNYNRALEPWQAFSGTAEGAYQNLQNPSGRQSVVSGLNNAGMAVGSMEPESPFVHATIWNTQTGAVQDLGTLGGRYARASALNEQGVVVGASSLDVYSENPKHAFVYRNGVMSQIASNLDQGGESGATSINRLGQTLGWYNTGLAANDQHNFLHTASGGAVSLDGLGFGNNYGARMNDQGQVLSGGALYNPTGTLSWAKTTGGSVGLADNWDSGMGFTPSKFFDVVVSGQRFQTVTADVSFEAKSLRIEGSLLGRTTLALSGGAVINALEGLRVGASGVLQGQGRVLGPAVQNYGLVQTSPGQLLQLDGGIDNHGLVTGNGRIEANVINRGGGATGIQVGAGQHLTLAGTVHSMADASHVRIQDGGTLAFEGQLINQGGATIEIQRGVLQVDYGAKAMQSGGRILVGSGRAEILGNVVNGPRGLIDAQNGADLTIWDALRNDGEMRVSGGARIVYAAAVSGKGNFTGLEGMHRFEGGYSPGASPAQVQMGNVQFASLVTMELGGLSPGSQYDRIVFGGSALFEETSFLQINLINGFTPHAGDHFALFSYAQAPVGSFEDFYLPGLAQGLSWDVSQIHSTGVLWVSGVPEPQTWALLGLGLACLFRRRPGRQIT